MKKDKVLIGILYVIVLILLGGCIYLWKETKMPSLNVSIGVTIDEDKVEFGEVIDDKDLVNNMLFGMIDSELIEKPEIAKNLPDANIRVDDVDGGICYMWAEVWIDGEDVIFSLDTKDKHANPRYKIIYGGFKELFL
ncbi:MAG: hypothetical protein ACRDD7_09095 [Peptostreptococcaceae bacterium]